MKKTILKLIGIVLVIGFAVSCYYDSEEAINPIITSSNVCDTLNVTYTKNISVILSSCVGCHSKSSAGGGIKLDSYADASTNAAASLADIKSGKMPKSSAKLGDCIVTQYEKWISTNKPQ